MYMFVRIFPKCLGHGRKKMSPTPSTVDKSAEGCAQVWSIVLRLPGDNYWNHKEWGSMVWWLKALHDVRQPEIET